MEEHEAAQAALKDAAEELKRVEADQARAQEQLKKVLSHRKEAWNRKAQLDLDISELEEKDEASNAAQVNDTAQKVDKHHLGNLTRGCRFARRNAKCLDLH